MLAQYKFLLDSFEFKTFLKYTSTELDTQYKALLVESPEEISEKY